MECNNVYTREREVKQLMDFDEGINVTNDGSLFLICYAEFEQNIFIKFQRYSLSLPLSFSGVKERHSHKSCFC